MSYDPTAPPIDMPLESAEANATAPPKKHRFRIVLIVLATLLAILCLGGKLKWDRDHEGYPATLNTDNIPGYVRSTLPYPDELRAAKTALNDIGFGSAFASVYEVQGGQPSELLYLFGGTKYTSDPAEALNSYGEGFIEAARASGAQGVALDSVDAGPQGGEMRCGHAKTSDADVSFCIWADHGSLVAAMFLELDANTAHDRMLKIRASIETH